MGAAPINHRHVDIQARLILPKGTQDNNISPRQPIEAEERQAAVIDARIN